VNTSQDSAALGHSARRVDFVTSSCAESIGDPERNMMDTSRTHEHSRHVEVAAAPAGPAASAVQHGALLMRVLDEIDYGLVIVATDGAMRYANQLGLKELLDNGALQLTQGRVQARHAADQAALATALGDVRRGLRKLVSARHEGTQTSVAVIPVAGADEPGGAVALLVFGKRHSNETLSVDFYARTHSLTGAETNVLKAMCSGLKPKEIARRQGVAISTVRSHICSIRVKTQTGSIRELLGRVAVLPPITPAVKTLGTQAPAPLTHH
jgi:DNA-binding CsgD family transcriptional regulator